MSDTVVQFALETDVNCLTCGYRGREHVSPGAPDVRPCPKCKNVTLQNMGLNPVNAALTAALQAAVDSLNESYAGDEIGMAIVIWRPGNPVAAAGMMLGDEAEGISAVHRWTTLFQDHPHE